MNKILSVLLLIFLFFPNWSNGQNYEVTYEYKVEKIKKRMQEKIDPDKRASSIVLKAIPYLSHYKPVLQIDGNESSYFIEKQMDIDSGNPLAVKISKILSGYNDTPIYQNSDEKRSLKTIETFDESFLVEYPFEDFDWKITDEKKKINGIICQKATTRKKQISKDDKSKFIDIEAWFAPSIPLSFGPLSYGGLPGLILELSRNNGSLIRLKSLKKSKNKESIKKPEGKPISHREYLQKFKELTKNSAYSKARKMN